MNDLSVAATMRCPACQAEQAWSAECRRCKCDLRLLWQAHAAIERIERDCLEALARGDFAAASRLARQAWQWRPNDPNRRRLAACSLLCGDWPTAWDLASELRPGVVS